MLLRLTNLIPSLSPIVYTAMAQIYRLTPPRSPHATQINPNLLDRFSKEQTMKALEYTQEISDPLCNLSSNEIIQMTNLAETVQSTSDRVFDVYNKKFFALKVLKMDSLSSWRHLNLVLKHYHRDFGTLNRIFYTDYVHATNEVRIISQSELATLSDYAHFRQVTGTLWTKDELKTLMWHLLNQINALSELGASCSYIKPEQVFIDHTTKALKLFDYSGFNPALSHFERFMGAFKPSLNIDSAVLALVTIVNPYAPVDNPQEARAFIRANLPEFVPELKDIEKRVGTFIPGVKKGYRLMITEQISNNIPIEHMFANKEFEAFVEKKLKDTLDSKDLKYHDEIWGMIQQSLGNYPEAINIFKKVGERISERYDATTDEKAQILLDLAEAYKAQGNINSATEYFKKFFENGEDLARGYNEYGKLLSSQYKFEEALKAFEKASEMTKNGESHSQRLLYEIKKNCGQIEKELHRSEEPRPKKLRNLIKKLIICFILYNLLVNSTVILDIYDSPSQSDEQITSENKAKNNLSSNNGNSDQIPPEVRAALLKEAKEAETKRTNSRREIQLKMGQKDAKREQMDTGVVRETSKDKKVDKTTLMIVGLHLALSTAGLLLLGSR